MDPTDTAPIPAESVGLSDIVRSAAADVADVAESVNSTGHERSTRPQPSNDITTAAVVGTVQKSSKRASRVNKMRNSHERKSSSRRRAAVDIIRTRKVDASEFLDSVIAETQNQQQILRDLRDLGASLLGKATLSKSEALSVVSVMSKISDRSTATNMLERAMSISSDRLTNLTLGADTAITQISGSIQDSNTSERCRATAAMLAIAATDRATAMTAKGTRGQGGSRVTPMRAVLEAVDSGEHILGSKYLSAPGIPLCTSSFTGRVLQIGRAAMFSRARRKETLHFKRMDSRVKRQEGGIERRRLARGRRENAGSTAKGSVPSAPVGAQDVSLPQVPSVRQRTNVAHHAKREGVVPVPVSVSGTGSSNMPNLG